MLLHLRFCMLTAELSAGLGNRLFALASALYLSKDCNEPLTIVWDVGNGFGATFQDLFELADSFPIYNISRDGFRSNPFLYLRSSSIIRKIERETTLLLRSGAIKVLFQHGNGYQTLRDLVIMEKNTHIDAYSYYLPGDVSNPAYYKGIMPSKKVLSFAEKDLIRIKSNTYGIHIRRTDHVDSIINSPTELFIDAISTVLADEPDATFYLASDSIDVINELQSMYGTQTILTQTNPILSRNSSEGAFCAFSDMLCLSKCKKIYGSHGSTFGKLASILGEKELIILHKED